MKIRVSMAPVRRSRFGHVTLRRARLLGLSILRFPLFHRLVSFGMNLHNLTFDTIAALIMSPAQAATPKTAILKVQTMTCPACGFTIKVARD